MITCTPPTNTTRRETIDCRGGSFTLLVQSPTYAQRLADEGWSFGMFSEDRGEAYAAHMNHRLAACVTGWEGVHDANGAGLVFSHEALRLLLGQHPDALNQVLGLLAKLFVVNGDELGKSAPTPAASGAPGDTDETPATP